jgi:hypothetical protein
MIFVGFDENRAGFKLFDPHTRTYHSAGDCYFYEDFSERVDALRHHDQRRALIRRGEDQPIVMNNFHDPSADVVRSLFLDPDAAAPEEPDDPSSDGLLGGAEAARDALLGGAPISSDAPLGGALLRPDAQRGGATVPPPRSALEIASDDAFPGGSSGPINMQTGQVNGDGKSGSVSIRVGDSSSGPSGDIEIAGGASTSSIGSNILIEAGGSSIGQSGLVSIRNGFGEAKNGGIIIESHDVDGKFGFYSIYKLYFSLSLLFTVIQIRELNFIFFSFFLFLF